MGTKITGNTGLQQALAQLATAYVLKNSGKDLDAATAKNQQDYQSELGGALEGYLRKKEGMPAQELEEGLQGPTTTGIPADQRGAILSAMASKFPEMQAIGKAEFGQLGKKPGFKEHLTQDGSLIRSYDDGKVTSLGNFSKPKDKWSEPYSISGADGQPILVKKNLTTNEIEPVDKGVKVTTNIGDGNKEALKNTSEVLKGAREEQLLGRKALQSAERIEKLAQDPDVITGFAAGPLQGFQSAATKLGFVGPESSAKSQALVSELAQQTLGAQQHLKGPTSDKDIAFLKEAAAGNVSYTPEALQYLAGLAKAAAHNQMLEAREQWESAATVKGADEIVKLYPQPSLGTWGMDPSQFEETANGRIRYKGGPSTTPRGPAPTPGQPAPRGQKLDARIKFKDL